MKIIGNQPYKIAIFRALQLGDLLVSVPALRALRAHVPGAQIHMIGLPWAADFVVRFENYLDGFIEFPGYPGLPERPFQVEGFIPFLQTVHEQAFDLVLQMQGNGSITNSLVETFGAKATAGFYHPGGYTPDPNSYLAYPEDLPEADRLLALLSFLGVPSRGNELEFPLSAQERRQGEQLIAEEGLQAKQYACVHPGARASERRWAVEKFASIADSIAASGVQVVLTGTSAERDLTRKVAARMKYTPVDLAGRTDLGALAVLLMGARVLVCNDTGVSHVAAALHCPSVVLFTVSDPNRWAPLDSSLHRRVQKAHQVDPGFVMQLVAEQMGMAVT